MKSIVILFIFLVGIACDTMKDLPENTSDNPSQEETSQSSDSGLPNQTLEIPGSITFQAKVVESYADKKNICGISLSNVVQLEVIEVLGSGSGIANLPHKKEVLLVRFLFAPKDLDPNTIITANAKESLCPDTSKTYFTVNSHEIIP